MKTKKLLNNFQIKSRKSAAIYTPLDAMSIFALGLWDDSGEVGGEFKKVIGHGHEFDKEKITDEVGDSLWYASRTCDWLDLKLGEVWENGTVYDMQFDHVISVADSRLSGLHHATLDCLAVMAYCSAIVFKESREIKRRWGALRGEANFDDKYIIKSKKSQKIALSTYIKAIKTLLSLYDISIEVVVEFNRQKLTKRYQDGFNTEASVNRADNQGDNLLAYGLTITITAGAVQETLL